MRKELLHYSFKNDLAHIPSALSMIDYLQVVFKYIKKNDFILLGKPFGAQAYYVLWKKMDWLKDINNLHMGVKHDQIDFVDYSEETIGNALGVASGIAFTTTKNIYVNITDATLQMGNTLEAIQFIGQHQQNIICTVDYNNAQVTGQTSDIISVVPVISMFRLYNWTVYVVDGHDKNEVEQAMKQSFKGGPVLIVCKTKKGKGIPEMENNIKEWHYRKLDEENFTQILNQIKE